MIKKFNEYKVQKSLQIYYLKFENSIYKFNQNHAKNLLRQNGSFLIKKPIATIGFLWFENLIMIIVFLPFQK